MTMKDPRFVNLLGVLIFFHCSTAWPIAKDDQVTMSGEPTHFQVDDKAAELEINANAMGVKVNAKPASLQVVSKPGAPSVPVAHPAVVVPQLPAPYLTAPYYPSPMIIGHRRTVRRRHHFFDMKPSMGNWNYKKDSVASYQHTISKKSKISSRKTNKKRQWIQRLPLLAQLLPYPQMTNVRVHPLVQQLAALSQAASRHFIPRLSSIRPSLQQFYSVGQRYPYMSPSLIGQDISQLRSSVYHSVLPSFPSSGMMYSTSSMMPMFHQTVPYFNPGMTSAPYNGYYDPLISRDFVPGFGTQGMPIPRTFIPGTIPGGMGYSGYTPMGLWRRVSKRLTIPHAGKKTQGNNHQEKNHPEKSKEKRSGREPRASKKSPRDKSYHNNGKNDKVAKRQFILTRPVIPRAQQVVMYVPVVTSPQATGFQPMSAEIGARRNWVLNLPSKTAGNFVLNLPSRTQGPQMYPTNPTGPLVSPLYKPFLNPGILGNQQNNGVAMGTQRSGIVMRAPVRSDIMPLTQLAGIRGQPIVQNSRHMTMLYNNDQLPSQVQDHLFGDMALQGRTRIPRRETPRLRNKYYDMDREDPDDSDYEPSSYSEPKRVDGEGSYTERFLPDGRTVLKKDHVGFGPITVQANTADTALRNQDDVTDMDLDSDKRKHIPRPMEQRNFLDKRLGIPKPEDKK